ncbi:cingulin-like [Hibiscus syriacus]|uniref:cingulin-like n=1 Tax=Hibiscus syriacus TaxID=106335 RepID=UPI001920A3A0|nr:cingulin-like [Hibiscus syriacus]
MNSMLEELEARDQRIQELEKAREKKKMKYGLRDRGGIEFSKESRPKLGHGLQRFQIKNRRVEQLTKEIEDLQTSFEGELNQSRDMNSELKDHVKHLEESLLQVQVPPGSMDLRLSREENKFLREQVRGLESELQRSRVHITNLERKITRINDGWKDTYEHHQMLVEEHECMMGEAIAQMSEVAHYTQELAKRAEVILLCTSLSFEYGEKVVEIMTEVMELSKIAKPYLQIDLSCNDEKSFGRMKLFLRMKNTLKTDKNQSEATHSHKTINKTKKMDAKLEKIEKELQEKLLKMQQDWEAKMKQSQKFAIDHIIQSQSNMVNDIVAKLPGQSGMEGKEQNTAVAETSEYAPVQSSSRLVISFEKLTGHPTGSSAAKIQMVVTNPQNNPNEYNIPDLDKIEKMKNQVPEHLKIGARISLRRWVGKGPMKR